MFELWKPKTKRIEAQRPGVDWLFANRRTLAEAQADRETLLALQTGTLKIHPKALEAEPWKTLLFRRDAAL